MSIEEQKKEFERIVGEHRLKFEKETTDWVVYKVLVSGMTISKFVDRARDAGFRVFYRDNKIGFKVVQ